VVRLFVAAFLLALWPNGVQAASAPKKIVIAHAAMNARVGPLWIARDLGLFAKYGVDADMIFVRSSPLIVAAMSSGEIKVGYGAGPAVIAAVGSGSDMKILSAFTNRVTYDLIARPGIERPEDLRGKKFGVQAIGGTLWMGAILGLEHLGLDPDRDNINILAVGDQTALAQALFSGTIDATVLDGVMSRKLQQSGFPVLADLNKANLPLLGIAIVARDPYIQNNPQIVQGVMKALIEGTAFALSPAQKPTTLKILQKYLKIGEAEAEEGYKDMAIGFDRKPYASPQGVMNIVRLMKTRNPKVEKVKPGDVIDDRILKLLDQSRFIDEMYARYGGK